jgi:hypothetical protein
LIPNESRCLFTARPSSGLFLDIFFLFRFKFNDGGKGEDRQTFARKNQLANSWNTLLV